MEETKEKDKTTGVVYISDNDNMFIAPEGISEEERKRLSLEVDRDLLKKKLEEIEAELEGMPETEAEQPEPPKEKKEEIERVQPYELPQDVSALPDFTVNTKNGPKLFSGMKVVMQDEENNRFYLDNGKEKLILPALTFKSIISPESLHAVPPQFKDAEIAEEQPAAVLGKTTLPEFSMITANGIEVFKELTVQKYNSAENSYTLSNGDTTITVTGDTFREINKPERYEKVWDENTPSYEKLIESQYDAYFRQRENTANNFIHNLSVYCRKEANTPLDALTISREIVSKMDKEEKEKTRLLLKQIAREDETINQVLVRTYYEAVKGVLLYIVFFF